MDFFNCWHKAENSLSLSFADRRRTSCQKQAEHPGVYGGFLEKLFWRKLFKKGKYLFEGRKKDKKELLDFYAFLLKKYPGIIGIEDPFAEEDWQGWGLMNSKFKKLL